MNNANDDVQLERYGQLGEGSKNPIIADDNSSITKRKYINCFIEKKTFIANNNNKHWIEIESIKI